jgi:hypothetical protein
VKRYRLAGIILAGFGLLAYVEVGDAQVVRLRSPSGGGGAATAITPGVTTVTGCDGLLLYGDASGFVNCEAGLGYSVANNQILAQDGSIANPAYSFSADTNTGFYRSGSDIWNEVNGGARTVVHTSQQVGYIQGYSVGWYSAGFAAFDVALTRNNVAGVIRVSDGSNGIRGLLGGGAAVASATALPVPTGRVFHVTGTTAITSITSTNFQSGACVTAIADAAVTFTDGGNLVLAGNFVMSAGDTISLCYDGTNWYETGRSNND